MPCVRPCAQHSRQMMRNMKVDGRNFLLPFQKGIIQANNALQKLYQHLQERFNIKYVLTYRLNQDVLENFFGIIRARGGLHDHPDQLEFKYRLRAYILGHNEGVLSEAANVEVDNTPDLERSEPALTGVIFRSIDTAVTSKEPDQLSELETLEYDGLENLAGYICHRLKHDVSDIAVGQEMDDTYTWVNHLTEGGLSKPTAETMAHIHALEQIFQANNKNGLCITKNFVKQHVEQAAHINCHIKIKKLFFRARMFFKIRTLNSEISNKATKRRKMMKITT